MQPITTVNNGQRGSFLTSYNTDSWEDPAESSEGSLAAVYMNGGCITNESLEKLLLLGERSIERRGTIIYAEVKAESCARSKVGLNVIKQALGDYRFEMVYKKLCIPGSPDFLFNYRPFSLPQVPAQLQEICERVPELDAFVELLRTFLDMEIIPLWSDYVFIPEQPGGASPSLWHGYRQLRSQMSIIHWRARLSRRSACYRADNGSSLHGLPECLKLFKVSAAE